MKRRIVCRPQALRDLDEIAAYTRRTWGEAKAKTYTKRLTVDVRALLKSPFRHALCENMPEGLRRRSCQAHVIFYIVHDERIEIVRIMHKQADVDAHLR